MNIKDKIKSIFTKVIDELPEDLGGKPAPGTGGQNYSEADLDKIKNDAMEAGKKKAALEYSEKEKIARMESRKKEIKDFCEAHVKDGKVIPAWIKMGMREFMESLDGEEVIEFAEGKKDSRLEWFKKFLGELPKVIEFKEIATRGTEAPSKFMEYVEQIQKEKKISRAKAIKFAAEEKPDLHQEYIEEINRK